MASRLTSRRPAHPPTVMNDIGTIDLTGATGNDLEIQAETANETASAVTAAAIAIAVTIEMLTVMKR